MRLIIILFFISIFLMQIFADNTNDSFDIIENYKITSSFGDSRNDHFHTGLDLAATDQDIYALTNQELIFYNKKDYYSIKYGMGDFAVLEDSNNKLRYNYSHLKEDSFTPDNVYWKKGDKIGVVGNSGHSTGKHLHLEVEDLENRRLLNPIQFIKAKDTMPPVIEDVYFITKDDGKISLY